MSRHRQDDGSGGGDTPRDSDFDPVQVRRRHDGWTPQRQGAFIRALAECGCVRDACRRVGMSTASAYALVRRPEAQSFRVAWELALDNAVRRIADAAFSRCIHGVAVPHFYKGEQVGEHRRFNDRLAMFLLRYRDPHVYGRHLDRLAPRGGRETAAQDFGAAYDWALRDAVRDELGLPRMRISDIPESDEEAEEMVRHYRAEQALGDPPGDDSPPDVASALSTSDPIFPSSAERD